MLRKPKIKLTCERCHGSGYVPVKNGDMTCPVCQGEGTVEIGRPSMDRTTELKQDYENMVGMFKNSIAECIPVEGAWFLREIVWEDGREVKIISKIKEDGCFEGCGPGATLEQMTAWGWTITPVVVLRVPDKEAAS